MEISQADIKAIAELVVQEITPFLVQKRWLTLREACDQFHIGEHRLKQLANAGIIKGYSDPDSGRGDWIFDRNSLDKYRESRSSRTNNIEEKFLALKAKARL